MQRPRAATRKRKQAEAERAEWEPLASAYDADLARAAAEQAKLEAHVVEVAAKAPAEQEKIVVAQAAAATASTELDEAETRVLIDAQLRAAGWEVNSKTLRWSHGARPEKGKNRAIAASLFERACNGGMPFAATKSELLTRACDLGDRCELVHAGDRAREPSGCNGLGELARSNGDSSRALALFERACEMSMQNLGCPSVASMKFKGEGTPKDAAGAQALLETACRAADGAACRILGEHLRDGAEMARSPVAAVDAFSRGCDRRNALCCNLAAEILEAKSGLTPDPTRAASFRATACKIRPERCASPSAPNTK